MTMARISVRYLQELNGELHYRRRVPEDVRTIFGKREWKHALGLARGQEATAMKLVGQYNAAYSQLIAEARIQRLTAQSPVMMAAPRQVFQHVARMPAVTAVAETPKVKLSAAYAYDKETHGGQRDEKAFKTAVDSFIELTGDVDLVSLTPKDVQSWLNKCEAKGQRVTTVGRRINALRALVNRYFREHEIEKSNPFTKPKLKSAGGSGSDRLPFHSSHLARIDRYFERAPRLTDEIRHVMALLKLTGARSLEIGGLDASDVLIDHEVPHVWLRNNSHRRLKTKGSERRVPLVGPALEAARQAKRTRPDGPLFSSGWHNTNSMSQRLNKLIRRAGVPKSERLVVYSFRHTLEEAMRSAGVPDHTQKRIMGHTDSSITGRYGAPAGILGELRDALKKAEREFGKVDLSTFGEHEKL